MTQLGRWQLPPVHLDAVLSYLGIDDLSLPLNSGSFGYTMEQWSRIVLSEAQHMTASGVLVDDEVEPNLEAALRVLARPHLWADSIWYPDPDQPHCWRTIVAVTEGERGPRIVLGVQPPSEDPQRGGPLTVEVHERVTASEVLLPTLPPAPPGQNSAVRVPVEALRPRDTDTEEGEVGTRNVLQGGSSARMSSGDRQVQLAMRISQLPRVRVGQFAANRRGRDGKRHRTSIIAWFDTPEPDGRYLNVAERGSTGEPMSAFIPADAGEIGRRIESLVRNAG